MTQPEPPPAEVPPEPPGPSLGLVPFTFGGTFKVRLSAWSFMGWMLSELGCFSVGAEESPGDGWQVSGTRDVPVGEFEETLGKVADRVRVLGGLVDEGSAATDWMAIQDCRAVGFHEYGPAVNINQSRAVYVPGLMTPPDGTFEETCRVCLMKKRTSYRTGRVVRQQFWFPVAAPSWIEEAPPQSYLEHLEEFEDHRGCETCQTARAAMSSSASSGEAV